MDIQGVKQEEEEDENEDYVRCYICQEIIMKENMRAVCPYMFPQFICSHTICIDCYCKDIISKYIFLSKNETQLLPTDKKMDLRDLLMIFYDTELLECKCSFDKHPLILYNNGILNYDKDKTRKMLIQYIEQKLLPKDMFLVNLLINWHVENYNEMIELQNEQNEQIIQYFSERNNHQGD